MPAAKPIEWNIEELVRLRLLHDAAFVGRDIRHYDKVGDAALEAIIIKAEKSDVNLDGVGGYSMTCAVIFQTTTLSVADADQLCVLISGLMYKYDPTFAPVLPDLKFVSLEPETNTNRTDTKKLRKRIITFPFIAKVID